MLERLSLDGLSLGLPELPSLSDAASAAASALDAEAQAATGFCASLSATAVGAFQRVEGPLLEWVPAFSVSVPGWLLGGFAPSSDGSVVPAAACAAATPGEWESAVGKSGLTWHHFCPNGGKDWSERVDFEGLSRFLRAQHPEKTPQHVAALTRLPADTVKKWLLGLAAPNGRALLVLACAYGPELMAAMLVHPPGWVVAAARAQKQAGLDRRLAALQAEMGRAA